MNEYDIITTGNITLKVVDNTISFPIPIQKKIDEIWKKLKLKNQHLHNGSSPIVLNVKKNNCIVEISYVDYKTIIADRELPELGINLNQIGVSGMIVFDDSKTVFAHRTNTSTEYPNFLELVPSGNLDNFDISLENKIDYAKKIKQEFEEETQISKKLIQNVKTLGLVKDNKNRIYDVCCILDVKTNEKELLSSFSKSLEYENPIIVNIENLESFMKKNLDTIVPTSKAFVSCYLNSLQ